MGEVSLRDTKFVKKKKKRKQKTKNSQKYFLSNQYLYVRYSLTFRVASKTKLLFGNFF